MVTTVKIKELKYTDKTGLIVIAIGHFTDVANEVRDMATIVFDNRRWWFTLVDGQLPDSAIQPSDMEWRIEAMLEENR